MIDREYTCMLPLVNLILTCDICGEVTNGREGGIRRLAGNQVGMHVVTLQLVAGGFIGADEDPYERAT